MRCKHVPYIDSEGECGACNFESHYGTGVMSISQQQMNDRMREEATCKARYDAAVAARDAAKDNAIARFADYQGATAARLDAVEVYMAELLAAEKPP